MGNFKRVIYDGKAAKLEVFGRNDKLFKSLPIHRKAIKAGLRVPGLYEIKYNRDKWYKVTEWVEGTTIYDLMESEPSMIDTVCTDLARYINELYDVDGISPVDNHFKNFVWSGNEVVYIDLKKLLERDLENHVTQMAKLCLKSCRQNKKKILAFLKEYSKHREVRSILSECERREWNWFGIQSPVINLEEVING